MDYEKKYKEALSRAATELETCGADKSLRNMIYAIFPDELKESEDEKIRKALVDALNKNLGNGIEKYGTTLNAALTWLEKQDKSSDQIHYWTEEEIEPIISDYLRGVEHYGGMIGRLRCLKPKSLEKQNDCSVKWQKNTPNYKPAINHSVLMKTTQGIAEGEWQGEYWFQYRWSWTLKDSDVLAWMELSNLDKQGEQNPTSDTRYEVGADGSLSVNGKPFDYEKATITQKDFAPEHVPKFKVGDWLASNICNSSDLLHIIDVDNKNYEIETPQGNTGVPSIAYIDNNFHLWTIEDAKDGDVLHSPSHRLIWIYKDNKHYHTCLNMNYVTKNIATNGLISIPNDACPASRVQMSILFQKMEEAGYEWNAEKKELKKIEDEIEIPFDAKDSELQEETYYIPKDFHAIIDDDKVVIKKGEKSAAWSEEDENYLQSAENACAFQFDMDSAITNWLKSLKDIIGG